MGSLAVPAAASPAGAPARPADGSSIEAPAGVVSGPPATSSAEVSTAATYSGSGYERAWFEDVAKLALNEVRSNVSFSYNGSCVTSASGSGYWWWRSGTGWNPPTNKGFWISTTCNNSRVRRQSTSASRAPPTDAPRGPMTGRTGGPMKLANIRLPRSHAHGRRQGHVALVIMVVTVRRRPDAKVSVGACTSGAGTPPGP